MSAEEVHLAYPVGEAEGGTGGEIPVSACFFTGPRETTMLVEFIDDVRLVSPSRECGDEDPYRFAYWTARALVLRAEGGRPAADAVDIHLPSASGGRVSVGESYMTDLVAGQRALLSVREADGEQWAMGWVPVTTSTDESSTDSANPIVQLPSTWSEVLGDRQQARNAYAQTCTGPDVHGIDDNRLMTDAEFDDWVHTPDGECIEPNADTGRPQGPNPNTNGATNGGT